MRFPNPFSQKRRLSQPVKVYQVWFADSCNEAKSDVNTTTIHVTGDNLSHQEAEELLIEQLKASDFELKWLHVLRLWRVK